MNTLQQFFEEQANRAQAYRDFSERYEHDATHLTGGEIIGYYRDLATCLSEQDMDTAHEQAFAGMSEEDRRGLAREYQYAGRDPTRPFDGYPTGTNFHQMMQPRRLGRMTRLAALQDGALLDELLGPDSPLDGSGAKDAIAATTVFLARRYLSKR